LNLSTSTQPRDRKLSLGNGDLIALPPVTDKIGVQYGEIQLFHQFFVLDSGFPIIIGRDLFPLLGFSFTWNPKSLVYPAVVSPDVVATELMEEKNAVVVKEEEHDEKEKIMVDHKHRSQLSRNAE
jgi:hypothetical protein